MGDVIEAVGGVNCHNDMNEVLKQIISAGDNVKKLLVRRPALVTLLRHEVLLRAPDGTDAWGECSATLFNTRQLVLEPLSGRALRTRSTCARSSTSSSRRRCSACRRRSRCGRAATR